MLHIGIDDTAGQLPGSTITVDLQLIGNPPTDAQLIALAHAILNTDVIQNLGWVGSAYISGLSRDSTVYLTP